MNYVKITNEESPVLIPYPNWEANAIGSEGSTVKETTGGRTNAPKATVVDANLADNSSIISTFRVRVDECDRLWVMDTGLADILGSPKQITPPALVIFDLNTDKLIRRYTFQPSDIKSETFFANVVCTEIHREMNVLRILIIFAIPSIVRLIILFYFLIVFRSLTFQKVNVIMHLHTFPILEAME